MNQNPFPSGPVTRVVTVSRISTKNQDYAALTAQTTLCRAYIKGHFQGPFEFITIATQGSGERLDRQELKQLRKLITGKKVDIVVAEDAGRIVRRIDIVHFCESCLDNDVRLIAINDHLDTADGNWRLNSIFAAMKHEQSNADTAARIIRQMNHNFLGGRCIMHLPPGIIRSASKSDTDLQWDKRHRKLFRVMFFLYERGWPVVRLAEWLRAKGVKIDNKRVRRLLNNPIFIGERYRGATFSRRIHADGNRKKQMAEPSNLKVRHMPQLAIIARDRFQRVQRLLEERGKKYVVGRNGRPDARKGRPRKHTAFPGQRITCGVCGRLWYWGGHGQKHHMSCSGERQYKCWVTATFDGNRARRRICKAILREAAKIEGFDLLVCQTMREEAEHCLADRDVQRQELHRQLAQQMHEADNLLKVSRGGGSSLELLINELAKSGETIKALENEIVTLDRMPKPTITLPSVEELRDQVIEAMEQALLDPHHVSEEIDRLVPSIVVYPVQPVDGGHVVLRATVELNLAALVTTGEDMADRVPALKHTITVDLFNPPERIRIRPQVMKALAADPKPTFKWIAANVTKCTDTAVQRSAALNKLMEDRGLTDAYVAITNPSVMTDQNQKHTRERFTFEPLAGFPKWPEVTPEEEERPAA